MTPDAYIGELRRAVRVLPPDEAEQAVAYYDEYLHEAEDPAVAMAQLGSPKEVAAAIVADYVGKADAKPGWGVLWAVIMGIFALPVPTPVAVVIFALVAIAVLILLAVVLGLLIGGVAACLAGVGVVVAGFLRVDYDVSTRLSFIGGGLLLAAIGLLWVYAMSLAVRACVSGLSKLVVRITRRTA